MMTGITYIHRNIANRVYHAVDELNRAIADAVDAELTVELNELDVSVAGDVVRRVLYTPLVKSIRTIEYYRVEGSSK